MILELFRKDPPNLQDIQRLLEKMNILGVRIFISCVKVEIPPHTSEQLTCNATYSRMTVDSINPEKPRLERHHLKEGKICAVL